MLAKTKDFSLAFEMTSGRGPRSWQDLVAENQTVLFAKRLLILVSKTQLAEFFLYQSKVVAAPSANGVGRKFSSDLAFTMDTGQSWKT